MNYNKLCYRCFAEKRFKEGPCPNCGHRNEAPQISVSCLAPGTLLNHRYVVGIALGVGGFGITYKCFDAEMGGICAVKEYFPQCFAQRDKNRVSVTTDTQRLQSYNTVLNRFVDEAKLLKQFNHPNIIGVYDLFFANNTAYYVMEYCDGIDLRRYTNDFKKRLTYDDGINIMYQVMNGLRYVHNAGVLHRDIAPDNIYVTKNNHVKILDFGSARHEADQINRNLSIIVKAGYAPIEQYSSRDRQGAYTDVYAFGATFYHLFTRVMPIESTQRMTNDKLVPFSQMRPDLPDNLKMVIERSMCLTINGRIRNFDDMMRMLGISSSNRSVKPVAPVPAVKPVNAGSVAGPVAERQVTAKQQASVSKRFFAYMLDIALCVAVYALIVFFAAQEFDSRIILSLLFPVFLFAVNTILELISGTSPGKALAGLRVCDVRLEKPKASQIILRNLVKPFGVISLPFGKNKMLLEDRVTTCTVCEK